MVANTAMSAHNTSPTLVGHCGITNDVGDCAAGERGAWNAGALGVSSLQACAAHCLAHCPRCAFVSFHAGHKDCSWYSSCAKLHFSFGGGEYRSLQVREPTSQQPPPHAKPTPPLPIRGVLIFSLMTRTAASRR